MIDFTKPNMKTAPVEVPMRSQKEIDRFLILLLVLITIVLITLLIRGQIEVGAGAVAAVLGCASYYIRNWNR